MKRTVLIIVLVVLGIVVLLPACNYNSLNAQRVGVDRELSNLQSQYQRRMDLIGNLVNTVKGAANFERETLIGVTEARAKASSIQLNPENMSEEQVRQFQSAQSGLNSALGRLLVSVEKYPELKANQNFLELQAQLEGTENRIQVAREKYNNVVGEYNTNIGSFPTVLYASMLGFKARPFFQADPASEKAPEVKF